MMSIFQNKPYPTRLPRKPRPKKSPTISVAAGISLAPSAKSKETQRLESLFEQKIEDVVYGKVSLLDAHRTQCKWIHESPMVCGEPVVNNSSWFKEHYQKVLTPYSVAKAAALELKKRRQAENWVERKKF